MTPSNRNTGGMFCAALLPCALIMACAGGQTMDNSEELAISKVVLYQNGVGYFERSGEMRGRQLSLRVRPDQINDVLKSLSILDFSGGQTSSVSLPVERSGDRLAAEIPTQVRRAKGMMGLLQVLRGIEVSVDNGDGWVKGRVVGVEGGGGSRGKVLTLMVDKSKLETIKMSKIEQVRIHDRALTVGLARSLDISKSEGSWKPVTLTVRLAGDEEHKLLISYIHEVPIWRPAYRAWVEKDKGVQLQGWAIVDNVTGEDWSEVKLSLIVGSPLSFRYNLHKPHHVNRPDLSGRAPSVAAAPPPPDVGYGDDEEAAPEPEASRPASRRRYKSMKKSSRAGSGMMGDAFAPKAMAPAPPSIADMAADPNKRREAMARSASALVKGRELGALYAYDALTPVTVPDGQAALINIVNRKVKGQDVFLFRNEYGNEAPFRAVLFHNTDASALESGPITLYVDGTFAGEGFLGRVTKGASTFVPYARESGFKVRRDTRNVTAEARLVTIIDGRITVEARREYKRIYHVRSERDAASLVYIKMRRRSGTKLIDPPKDLIRSGEQIYLPIHVPAKKEVEVTLVEQSPVRRVERHLTSLVIAAFDLYLKDAKADEQVAGPIRQVLAVNKQLADMGSKRNSLQQQRSLLDQEGRRIRSNLDALPMDKVANKLRKTLLAQLDDNSRKAAEVAKELVAGEVERAALQEKLVALLRAISLK